MTDALVFEELQWLTDVIVARMKLYFNQESEVKDINQITPPVINDNSGAYSRFITVNKLGTEDRILLILSWVPILKPQLLDCFQVKNSDTGQRFVEFGCVEGRSDGTIVPTLGTALFILAGEDIKAKMVLAQRFTSHPIISSWLSYHEDNNTLSFSNWILSPPHELLDLFMFERPFIPRFSNSFPAKAISTTRSWDELVLDEKTMGQVNEIKMWVKYGERIREEWHLSSRIKPGFRALFYGPSGCGKTFTATLLGKEVGKQVFCIDLSMVVSKYIGETEKNLAKVFELAENKDWILFFDEADALFGKRTNVKDSHDRYANQEVAYLLQRVEDYKGLVILSTNLKSNIDEAFARRFQIMVRFNMPNAQERERLWISSFSPLCELEETIDIKQIAEDYELAGGSIINVVQYCSISAMSREENIIRKADLLEGIRNEFSKVGKTIRE